MSSAQPPADGDRPAGGDDSAPASSAPAAGAPKPVTRRAPSARKRATTKTQPISPDGEAPEILDAMLGRAATEPSADVAAGPSPEEVAPARTAAAAKPATRRRKPAPAPDTSSSPVEPPVEAAGAPEQSSEPLGSESHGSEPHESEAATAVLPAATDYYREPTAETEILNPAEAAVAEQAPTDAVPAPVVSPSAEPVPVEAVAEEPRRAGEGALPGESSAPAGAPRPGRSVNELADRLDDSRFFSSLFDFTFTSYVTRKLAGPVYVVGLVLIGLAIVVGFANSLGIAIATRSPGGAFVFLLGVLVTLVAAILSVLLLRVTIEVFCAIIEIAQNTRRRSPPRD